jgi:hypothetical protein
MHARTRATLVAAVACAAAGGAEAGLTLGNGQSINVATLMSKANKGRLTIDGKLFTFRSFVSSSFTAKKFSLVAFVSPNANEFGLRSVGFDIKGPYQDLLRRDRYAALLHLEYRVEVPDAAYQSHVRLYDTALAFDGKAVGRGSVAAVTEAVRDADSHRYLGTLNAFDVAGPPRQSRFADVKDFRSNTSGGYRAFDVTKDLTFFAIPVGTSTATYVRQEFHTTMAPTPGTLALAAASGAVGSVRRRRRT